MKKILALIAGILTLGGGVAYTQLGASNNVSYTPDLYPITDSQYYVGTTTKAYKGGVFDELCLGGSCQTAWSAGSYPDYLSQVGDVSTTTLATGYVLKWSGTEWESVATSTLNITAVGDGDFSTTSADYWGDTKGYQTALDVYSIVGATTTLANLTITESQITDLDHYTDADTNAYIHGSTTIPKTYTANTFTGVQTIGNASTTYTSATRFFGDLTGTASGNLISGGTLTSAYHCRWDGTGIDCDRVEDASGACGANAVCMGGHTHVGVNEVYGSGWNGDVDPPEKDDVYDWGHLFDTDDDGKVNVVDTTSGLLTSTIAGVVSATNTPYVDAIVATSTTASSSLQWVTATAFGIVGKFFASATQFIVNLPAIFMDSLQIPFGNTPTVDSIGEIALKQSPANALVIATSTASTSPAIIPLALPIRFTVISSSTATTTVGYPTLDYNERVLVGVCKGAQTANIRVGDGTNWSNLVNIGTATTTITFTSETTFNKGGEMLTFEVGPTATNEKAVWCSFRRAYEL